MPGRWLYVGHPESESLPDGWTDEILVHTVRKMKNGTLTVLALVNVYDSDNKCKYTGETVVNLKKSLPPRNESG